MPGFWGEGRGVDKAEEEDGELRKVSKAAIRGGSRTGLNWKCKKMICDILWLLHKIQLRVRVLSGIGLYLQALPRHSGHSQGAAVLPLSFSFP